MSKTGALASALRSSGANVAATPVTAPVPVVAEPPVPKPVQPSRRATKAITVHYPAEVRRQLKLMAAEQGRNIDDVVAEALNLVFAKYRKAEIAPRKTTMT
jgi:hypothetical protein